MKRGIIYVYQFGAWWSLSPEQAIDLLAAIKAGREWNLDHFGRRLRSRPRGTRTGPEGNIEYWGAHPLWRMPCDWTYGDENWLIAHAEAHDLLHECRLSETEMI